MSHHKQEGETCVLVSKVNHIRERLDRCEHIPTNPPAQSPEPNLLTTEPSHFDLHIQKPAYTALYKIELFEL